MLFKRMVGRAFVGLTVLLYLSVACQNCNSSSHELIGQKVVIPTELVNTFNGKDTLLPDVSQSVATMLIWYDSLGCSSCRISHMAEWNEWLIYSKALQGNFQVVFVVTPKARERKQVRFSLMAYQIDHPVRVDTVGYFLKMNPKLSSNGQIHVLLLDEQGSVVLAGNPLEDVRLMQRYKEEIKRLLIKK